MIYTPTLVAIDRLRLGRFLSFPLRSPNERTRAPDLRSWCARSSSSGGRGAVADAPRLASRKSRRALLDWDPVRCGGGGALVVPTGCHACRIARRNRARRVGCRSARRSRLSRRPRLRGRGHAHGCAGTSAGRPHARIHGLRCRARPRRLPPGPRRMWGSGGPSSTGRSWACMSPSCRTARCWRTTRSATTPPRRTPCTTTHGRPCGIRKRASRRRSTSTPASTSSVAAWRISSTAACSSRVGTRTHSSTASFRHTSSTPPDTRGASGRTWRLGAGIRA